MSTQLSKNKISSFCGDVVPLYLKSDKDLKYENIIWNSDNDAVFIREFCGTENYGFNHGVLLTLSRVGECTVTAEYESKKYVCKVEIRERMHASSEEKMQYYIGDLHDHMSLEHDHDKFAERDSGFPCEYINQLKEEKRIDFAVISDHGDVTNKTDFFRGFTDADEAECDEVVIFPGSESEVNAIEYDRFGIVHKNSGEIVCLNTSGFVASDNWQTFYDEMKNNPSAVCILAHPQIIGWDPYGIWDFSLSKNRGLSKYVRLVEMGDGSDRGSNIINEYVYSNALDNGFKVSVCCSSDSHGPEWGYDVFPGKTVVMATEKSKEAFLDALLSNRVYACESGNIKLSYTVNGQTAPCTLSPDTSTYKFSISLSYFHDDKSTVPVRCEIISDYGKIVGVIENISSDLLDVEVRSDTARYFYLKFVDCECRRTFSMPVWTGRAADEPEQSNFVPLDKSEFKAYDEYSGSSADEVVNGNPLDVWHTDECSASIVIDMGYERDVCAIAHYPVKLDHESRKKLPDVVIALGAMPHRFTVSASADGTEYTKCTDGIIRVYGNEEVFEFPKCRARFLRFEAKSTSGTEYNAEKFKVGGLSIAELTPMTKID